MSTEQSALQFAAWLRRNHPKIYQRAVTGADNGTAMPLSGLGEEAQKEGWFDKFLGIASSAGATYLNLKNQRDMLQLNIDRAKANMPPIEFETTPTIKTQVEIEPEVVDKITRSVGADINKILMFTGIGLAAFLLLR